MREVEEADSEEIDNKAKKYQIDQFVDQTGFTTNRIVLVAGLATRHL